MKLAFTPRAERDLERIAHFIGIDNPIRAVSFLEELQARCATLTEFPKRFPLVERPNGHGIRKCGHGSYLIFYRIEPDVIRILHILHGATDYGPLLEGL